MFFLLQIYLLLTVNLVYVLILVAGSIQYYIERNYSLL